MRTDFTRDRLTWTAYALLAWFAYLQAAPGLIVPDLRRELDLSYAAGALYVTAFALGATIAGLLSSRLERAVGRRALLWSSITLMSAGTVGLAATPTTATTLSSTLAMGFGGGLVLATIQAILADHHRERRTVALAEANVAASASYLLLIGGLTLAAALGAGWRVAVLVSLVVPLALWWQSRAMPITSSPGMQETSVRPLPAAFWIAAAILVCTTGVEWTVTAWGATYVDEATAVTTDTAVALMGGYFGGFLAGRVVGSRLAHRHPPARLLAWAIAAAGVGFAALWTATEPVQATAGLLVLGIGVGNLFPMALSAAVAIAPDQAGQASGRAVTASAGAVLLAPLTVRAVADATSLHAALTLIPALLALAAIGLTALTRAQRPAHQPERAAA